MIKWDMQHTLMMVAVTLIGATAGYIEQQSADTLLAALQSKAALKHMLFMMLAFDMSALAALAKQSFLTPRGNGGNGTAGNGPEQKAMPSSFPKKPAAMRVRRWAAVGMLGVSLSGCAAWDQFVNNPVAVATDLSHYVMIFVQTAETIWNAIAPLLGDKAPKANAEFHDAIVTLQQLDGTLMDAVNVAAETKNASPDFSKIIADVNDAVQRVLTVINTYRQPLPSGHYGGEVDNLTHMAQQIKTWRKAS